MRSSRCLLLVLWLGCADASDRDDHAAGSGYPHPPCASLDAGTLLDASLAVDTRGDDAGGLAACEDEVCFARASAAPLAAEAGFVALAPGFFGSASSTARARAWYAFQPASSNPERRPLIVVMQGGPVSGMVVLWGGNTGAQTLDPSRTGASSIAANPASWTRFANLLYIDSPYAGFSYIVEPSGAGRPKFEPHREAQAYLRLLLAFLERHPELIAQKLVLAGESYGGARAAFMLDYLLDPARLRAPGDPAPSPSLADQLEVYLRRALGPQCQLDAATIGSHFAQVLVQPAVVSGFQLSSAPTERGTALRADSDDRFATMTDRVVDPGVLDALSGVRVADIPWFASSERALAAPASSQTTLLVSSLAAEQALRARFGPLPEGHSYYVLYTSQGGFDIRALAGV